MTTVELDTPAGVRRDPYPRPWTAAEFARACGLGVFAGRAAELHDAQIVERTDADLRPFVFTRKEYASLYDNQFFQNQRVQLIAGEILRELPMNRPHAKSMFKTTKALERAFSDDYHVQCQIPLGLGLTSQPIPDAAVILGTIDDYDDHPTTAVLVVEVSETTYDSDVTKKASLYAAAGITDYWIVDIARRRVLVMRDPRPHDGEPHGYRYAALAPYADDATIAPLAAPTARVRVADLLP